MAKRKVIVGNVTKSTKDNSFYIKINDDITLRKGDYLNLENEKSQLAAIDYALSQGWVDEAEAEKRRNQTIAYWNDPVPTRDGKSFVRKATTQYQVTVKKD